MKPNGRSAPPAGKRVRSFSDIWRLARWLLGFLRPYLGLFLLATLFTIGYAWANALRAVVAGGFIEYVLPQSEAKGAALRAKEAARAAKPDAAAPAFVPETVREAESGLKARAAALLPERGDTRGWIRLLAIAAVAVAITLGVTDFLKTILTQAVVVRIILDIQQTVLRHLLSLSLRFFSRRKLGDLFSRLTSDILQTQQALTFLFGEIFEDFFRIVAHGTTAIVASPLLAGLSALFVPAIALPLQAFARKVRKRARGRQESGAEALEAIQQMLSGIRTIKVFNREDFEGERLRRRNRDFFRSSMKVVRIKAASRGLLELISNVLVPVFIVAGVYFLGGGHVSAGALAVFVASVALMYEPCKRLVRAYNNLQESLAGADRVWEVLGERPEIEEAPDAVDLEKTKGHVRVRNVSFAYAGEPVLRNVSVEALPGEVVAVVGPSGAGKSTLLDLVARLYDPDEGTIEVDGIDIRKLRRAALARHMAIVTQDPFLFNDTVLENLRYGNATATEEQVRAACAAANILDVIQGLPQGFQTVVGDRGATLSGGQRQRITIARALLKDATILLLDEATSALDAESERAVQEALERLMRGRTTFVIAHRLSTIVAAHKIVVLDDGRVVEEGRHDELLARGGLYAKLCDLQAVGAGAAGKRGEVPPGGDA